MRNVLPQPKMTTGITASNRPSRQLSFNSASSLHSHAHQLHPKSTAAAAPQTDATTSQKSRTASATHIPSSVTATNNGHSSALETNKLANRQRRTLTQNVSKLTGGGLSGLSAPNIASTSSKAATSNGGSEITRFLLS